MKTVFEIALSNINVYKKSISISDQKYTMSYKMRFLDFDYKNTKQKEQITSLLEDKLISENNKIINFTEEEINRINKFVESDDLLNLQLAIEIINLK